MQTHITVPPLEIVDTGSSMMTPIPQLPVPIIPPSTGAQEGIPKHLTFVEAFQNFVLRS